MGAKDTAFVVLLIIAALDSVFSEDDWIANPKYEIEASGPTLSLKLRWEPAPCDENFEGAYVVDVCNSKLKCSSSVTHGTKNGSIVLEHEGFDFLYWSIYTVTLRMECPSGETFVLEPFEIHTGAGELLPLNGLTIAAQDHNAVVAWNLTDLNEQQDAATHVVLSVCKSDIITVCLPPVTVPKSQSSYKITGLIAGMSYTVGAKMYREEGGKPYESKPFSMVFETEAEKSLFPPVQHVMTEVTEFLNDATVSIVYDKPERRDDFWGAEIYFTDKRNLSLERRRTQDTPIVVEGLPTYTELMLHVKALYNTSNGLIRSESVDLPVVVRGGVVPKPEITRLIWVDGRTVLIQWDHPMKEAEEIHYTVSWGQGNSRDFEEDVYSFALIQAFAPEETYNFTVTLHVEFYDRIFSNVSDPMDLTMPPANALIPQVEIWGVTGLGIEVHWDVLLPSNPKECTFLVKICPLSGKPCFTYSNLPHDTRSLHGDFLPYEEHNVTVTSACRYFKAKPVTATSAVETVFAALPPPRVKALKVWQEPSSRILKVTWQPPDFNLTFVLNYRIDIVGKVMEKIIAVANTTSAAIRVPADPGEQLLVEVRAFFRAEDGSAITGLSVRKTLNFYGIPPPTNVKLSSVIGNVYKFEVIPKSPVEGVNFTYQVAKADADFSREPKTEGLVLFRETEPYKKMALKARVCNDDLCSPEYSFEFTTNVGEPSEVRTLKTEVFNLTNIRITWEAPAEPRGPMDGYEIIVFDKETDNHTEAVSKVASYNFISDKEHGRYEVRVDSFNEDLYGGERKHSRLVYSPVETSGMHPPPPMHIDEDATCQDGSGFRWQIPRAANFTVVEYRLVASIKENEEHEGDFPDKYSSDDEVRVVTSTCFPYRNLKPESYYTVRISSCSDTTESSCGRFSKNFEIATSFGYPAAPELQLVEKKTNTIVVRWLAPKEHPEHIEGYEVAISDTEADGSALDWTDLPQGTLHQEFKDLVEDTEYEIHVRAYNIDRNSLYLRSPESTLIVETDACGKSVFWTSLFAVFGLAAVGAVLYVTYIKYKRQHPDEEEIVMGEEPLASDERVNIEEETSVLPP